MYKWFLEGWHDSGVFCSVWQLMTLKAVPLLSTTFLAQEQLSWINRKTGTVGTKLTLIWYADAIYVYHYLLYVHVIPINVWISGSCSIHW